MALDAIVVEADGPAVAIKIRSARRRLNLVDIAVSWPGA